MIIGRSWSSRLRVDTLTETVTSRPSCRQRLHCSSEASSTRSVSGLMIPVCSASGMNPSGPMQPSCGWFQRTSASTRQRRAALQRHLRLVVDDQLAALDPAAQLCGQREPVDAVLVVLLGVGVRSRRPSPLAQYIATSA